MSVNESNDTVKPGAPMGIYWFYGFMPVPSAFRRRTKRVHWSSLNTRTGDSASLLSRTPTTAGPVPTSVQLPASALRELERHAATSMHAPLPTLRPGFRRRVQFSSRFTGYAGGATWHWHGAQPVPRHPLSGQCVPMSCPQATHSSISRIGQPW